MLSDTSWCLKGGPLDPHPYLYLYLQVGALRQSHGTSQGILGTLSQAEAAGTRVARVCRNQERRNGSSCRVAAPGMVTSEQVPRDP